MYSITLYIDTNYENVMVNSYYKKYDLTYFVNIMYIKIYKCYKYYFN